MATKVVDIVLDNGEITVSPTTLYAKVGETIQWQAFGAEGVTVAFRDGGVSPATDDTEVRSGEGELDPKAEVGGMHDLLKKQYRVGPVATGRAAVPGTHHYYVGAVHDNHVYMISGCPEVIIR